MNEQYQNSSELFIGTSMFCKWTDSSVAALSTAGLSKGQFCQLQDCQMANPPQALVNGKHSSGESGSVKFS